MTLTAAQLEQRRKGISSSDIPAILGMDPFGKGPFQVWLEKVHPEDIKPKDGGELEIGTRLEPFVAQWCSEIYEPLEKFHGTISHKSQSWMLATPDYHNASACDVVPLEPWEIKAWLKDPGDYVEAQTRWQVAVLDAPRGHVGWWRRNGYEPPEHRVIERDLEAEKLMIAAAKDFWFGYVVTKKEPPPDASDECGRWFARHKIAEEQLDVDEAHEITKAMRDYKLSGEHVATVTELHSYNANRLKSLCRDLKRVNSPIGSLTYPLHKGRTTTDWETIARRFMGMIVAPEGDGTPASLLKPKADLIALCESIIKQHTVQKDGYRQLHLSWSS